MESHRSSGVSKTALLSHSPCRHQIKGPGMRRRDFIPFFAGAMVGWPLAAHAQQADRMRRIGVLVAVPADIGQQQVRLLSVFQQVLQQLGWTDGSNVRIDYRWGAGSADDIHKYATELVALAPDVILVTGEAVERLLQVTRAVTITKTIGTARVT